VQDGGVAETFDAVKDLYIRLLHAWNTTDAAGLAEVFLDDGEVIGFDGSILTGRGAIEAEMRRIFADHRTGTYVGVVDDVATLTPDVAVLRAAAGVIPAGASEVVPALNSVQRVTAVRRDGRWSVALYHNTPAQFHGRPEMVDRMTGELRRVHETEGAP
jgi:uncharacterized protein (TIGR02246 family)